MQTKIIKKVTGNVDRNFIRNVIKILNSFYDFVSRKGISIPPLVEVYFYENKEKALMAMELESYKRGVAVLSLYPTMYEAWTGFPRIHIIANIIKGLSYPVFKSLVLHEAGHSILHSSVSYYVLSISLDKNLRNLSYEELAKILVIASSIVKDLDVVNLLMRLGLEDDIASYVVFLFHSASTLECNGTEQVLNFMKILAPLLFIKKENLIKSFYSEISGGCQKFFKESMGILQKVWKAESDFDQRVLILVKEILRLNENRQL